MMLTSYRNVLFNGQVTSRGNSIIILELIVPLSVFQAIRRTNPSRRLANTSGHPRVTWPWLLWQLRVPPLIPICNPFIRSTRGGVVLRVDIRKWPGATGVATRAIARV